MYITSRIAYGAAARTMRGRSIRRQTMGNLMSMGVQPAEQAGGETGLMQVDMPVGGSGRVVLPVVITHKQLIAE